MSQLALKRWRRWQKVSCQPKNPERICWGCDEYCPADAMRCGNGADRTAHPAELFGDDWQAGNLVVIRSFRWAGSTRLTPLTALALQRQAEQPMSARVMIIDE
jgi:hypothetical protein